jgi:hypothetical protein
MIINVPDYYVHIAIFKILHLFPASFFPVMLSYIQYFFGPGCAPIMGAFVIVEGHQLSGVFLSAFSLPGPLFFISTTQP